MNDSKAYWYLTIALIAFIFMPTLFQRGMFLDGIVYATIARNLAQGYGQFWALNYTLTFGSEFFSHPPLAFGLLSLLYKMVGDHFFVERLYSFLTFCLSAYGIVLCWHLLARDKQESTYCWIPILIWISMPLVGWSYSNNMLENTMTPFVLFSVYFISKALRDKSIQFLFLGSAMILLAFLSKGPVGLFPLLLPFIYPLVYSTSYKKIGYYFSIISIFLISSALGIYIIWPNSLIWFQEYLSIQIFPALLNQGDLNTNFRLSIVIKLISELAIPVACSIPILLMTKHLNLLFSKRFKYFLLIALAATLPLLLTLKQSRYYLTPALPFYSLAIGFYLLDSIKYLMRQANTKYDKIFSILPLGIITIAFAVSALRYGSISRNEAYVKDSMKLANHLPYGTMLSTSSETCNNWILTAYLARYGYLSLNCESEEEYRLLRIGEKLSNSGQIIYNKDSIELENYILYRSHNK